MSGWIEPPNPGVTAEYWVIRRAADVAPGAAGRDLPDIRVRYRWDGNGAWFTGDHYECTQWRDPVRVCLHSDNGWRIERLVEDQSP